MLTIESIRNPKRKSGFNHVALDTGGGAAKRFFRAEHGRRDKQWRGPRRDTALEAAQDYIDYVNSRPPLTIEDIRNPARKSGFDHVSPMYSAAKDKGGLLYYKAQVYGGKETNAAGHAWVGTSRKTPEEAAQDYCDYVNAKRIVPATLKTAGHEYVVDERDTDPEYQAALGVIRDRTAQRRTKKQGYVYLIIEDGDFTLGKVGYSVNPAKRVAELQTGNPRVLRLAAFKPATEADEKALHARYIKSNVLQEWFHLTDALLSEFGISPAAQSGGKTHKEVAAA